MRGYLLAVATLIVMIVGPALLAVRGAMRHRPDRAPRATLDGIGSLATRSTLSFVLAFNLTFFLQELFLVIPKALTPGLRPTLFHNNHTWDGTHPLAALFQGTGALATLLSATACFAILRRVAPRSATTRLFLIWMTYCGAVMALPQFAIGALSDDSDLGMAMGFLGLSENSRMVLGLMALAAIPPICLGLLPHVLSLARDDALRSASGRTRFVFFVATLPALAGACLCVAYRVPREWIEVVIVPAWVALFGAGWMLAGAWQVTNAPSRADSGGSPWIPAMVCLALWLIFQFALRPGLRFY